MHFESDISTTSNLQVKSAMNPDLTLSLPPEILVRIFHLYVSSLRPELEDSMSESNAFDYSWLPILEVCQRWYAVATHCPALWCDIHFPVKHPFVEFCLQRSQNVPLTVIYSEVISGRSAVESLKMLLLHMHRIRHLVMTLRRRTTRNAIQGLVHQPAPILEYFSIDFSQTTAYESISPNLSLPLTGAHLLHNLYLCGQVHISDDVTTLPSLRNLALDGPNTKAISVSGLLHTINRMPALTYARIQDIRLIADDTEPLRTVTAAHLGTLALNTLNPEFYAKFLDYLITPGTMCITLEYSDRNLHVTTITPERQLMIMTPLLQKAAGANCTSTPPPILSFHIDLTLKPDTASFDALRTAGRMYGSSPPAVRAFHLLLPARIQEIYTLVAHMSELLQGVRHLSFRNFHPLPQDGLPRLSSLMPNVQTLSMSLLNPAGVNAALLESDLPDELPWPHLTHLILHCIEVSRCHCGSERAGPVLHSGCTKALREALFYRRQDIGFPLRRLTVEDIPSNRDYNEDIFRGCAEVVQFRDITPDEYRG